MEPKHTSFLVHLKETEDIKKGLAQDQRQQVYGVTGAQSAYVMAGLCASMDAPALVVTYGAQQAHKVADDLRTFLPDRDVLVFPELETLSFGMLAQSKDTFARRLEVLSILTKFKGEEQSKNKGPVIVASGASITRKLIPADEFRKFCRILGKGALIKLAEITAYLVSVGYERVDLVEGRGQFSIRGDIFDIFPLTSTNPVRLELFGDEIESMRQFSVASQRSHKALDSVFISPAREFVYTDETLFRAREKLSKAFLEQQKRLHATGRKKARQKLVERSAEILARLEQHGYFYGLEEFFSFFYGQGASILGYFAQEPLVFIDELGRVYEHTEHVTREKAEGLTQLLEQGLALPEQEQTSFSQHDIWDIFSQRKTVAFSLLPRQVALWRPLQTVALSAKTLPTFQGRMNLFIDELSSWRKRGYAVVIIAANEDRIQRIRQVLAEGELSYSPNGIFIAKGALSGGFDFPLAKLAVVTDTEIFGFKKVRPRAKVAEGAEITRFSDLSYGDYVVHEQHGIGRYIGIQQLEVEGTHKDYFLIQYAGEDRLYIPTDQLSLLQKYLGAEQQRPKINKLGGNEWNRVKNRVRESVEKMAEDLLELYAARQATKGYAFGTDTPWQREFEDAFPFEETPDQLNAILEIKRDLEILRPMDRLLCGDVGYGKTEVAIRAAFKVVMEGKQVVVLVPTTVLAQQHLHTFGQRFKGYPVQIEMLSRFKSPKEQKEILAKLKRGGVDIIIGTHRLVQGDVELKDLGLLIVDEEHRFGVVHKEKLKRLRLNVDVLTLTATPIPRTMYMSLIGVRDMSVLENPPEDRLPVQTYVIEFTLDIIREAIRREVDRGGQVFFVYNRIQDIDKMAAQLQKALPDVRFAIAHGQMKESELEEVMVDFVNGQFEVLLCTTIIESGLDMPNVNTIVVHDADKLGLSQLYQLRGRVGRSFRQAYAYFTYRKDKALTEIAEKRLHAIREFTEFGSGFKIALRDLEIRGAGNILGAEQHGHMAAVGFAMYCRLLEEAVQSLKGEKEIEKWEPHIELKVDAFLPAGFIQDNAQKIEAYYDIMHIKNKKDLTEVTAELKDRYGNLPQPVLNLLTIADLKNFCFALGIKSISHDDNYIVIEFSKDKTLNSQVLAALVETYGRRLIFSSVENLKIKIFFREKGEQILHYLTEVLNKINNVEQQFS